MSVKTPLRFIRVRHLELRSYCPTKKKTKDKITSSHLISFPSVCLPLVVTFIFIVSLMYLIVIHQTIKSYKLRNRQYEDCYFPNDSKTVQDLASSQKVLPSWPSGNYNGQEVSGARQVTLDRYREQNLRRRHVEHDRIQVLALKSTLWMNKKHGETRDRHPQTIKKNSKGKQFPLTK